MTENHLSEECLAEKTDLQILCVKVGWIEKRRSSCFRARYTSERYPSCISLDKKLSCHQEKPTYFLRVYVHWEESSYILRCLFLKTRSGLRFKIQTRSGHWPKNGSQGFVGARQALWQNHSFDSFRANNTRPKQYILPIWLSKTLCLCLFMPAMSFSVYALLNHT